MSSVSRRIRRSLPDKVPSRAYGTYPSAMFDTGFINRAVREQVAPASTSTSTFVNPEAYLFPLEYFAKEEEEARRVMERTRYDNVPWPRSWTGKP